jgi:hypothetical protein
VRLSLVAVEKLIKEFANHGQFNPASSQHLAYEECGEHCWDEDYDSDYELDEPKNDEPKKEVKPVTLDNLSENINLRLSTLWVQRMGLAVGSGLGDLGSLQGARVRPSSKVTRSVQCPESLRLLLCAHPYSETPAAMCGRCFRNNCWLTLRTHRHSNLRGRQAVFQKLSCGCTATEKVIGKSSRSSIPFLGAGGQV